MSHPHRFRRKTVLIKPGLQLWLVGVFLGLSALSMMLQFVLFTNVMQRMATELPNDGPVVMEALSDALWHVLGMSFLVFLPLTLMVGVLCTFRVAGPLHRFETFLRQVIAGEGPADFSLRSKDKLGDLAGLLNEATRPLRDAQGTSERPPVVATADPEPAREAA